MEISIYNQLIASLYSIILGSLCWGIYELIKLIRMIFYWDYSEKFRLKMGNKEYKTIKNPLNIKIKGEKKIRFVVALIFDLLYFLILSIIFPIFIYIANGGVFRWYIFAFALLGFVIFKISLGKLLNITLEYINYYTKVLLLRLLNPIKRLIYKIRRKMKTKRVKEKKEKLKERQILFSYGIQKNSRA